MAIETHATSSRIRIGLQALLAHRWATLLVAWPVFFLVYGQVRLAAGGSARVLLIAAVIATAWYRGAWVGALAGLFAVPIGALQVALLTGGSLAVQDWFTADVAAGTLASILAGGAIGYMQELNQRLTAEAGDRRKAEDDLRDSEARLRVLLDHYFDGIAVVENAEIVYVNPSLCRMLGRTANDLIGSAGRTLVDEHIAAQHRDRALRRIQEILNGAPEYPSEYEGRRSDGSAIPLEVTTRAIQFGGKPALLTTLRDLTARHEAETRIRESEQRFRSLFEQAPIGIVLADADTRFIRVNQSFCEMLGYTEAELRGRSFVEISHPDDAGGTPDSARKVLGDAASVLRLQKRYLRKDGGTVEAETTVSLTRDQAGQLLYAVAMVEDITEKSHLEEQLRQSQRLESVGQLAGGVAHNFNNALTAIIGYSELLGRRFDGHDAGLKEVEQIQRVAEQAATLTRQLLTFSRKDLVRPSVFCLNAAVETTSALLSPLIGDQIRLRLKLDRNLRNVRADRAQIEQVITNLVFNARDALRDGGALSIATADIAVDAAEARQHHDARPGAYVRLSVSDTGTGIEPTALPRIFEPFFTTKDQGEGVGLGLAMVHGAIKQSGGYVKVRSEPGQGATFELYLPVHAEPADNIEPAVEQSATG